MNKLLKAARDVVDGADDTGCDGDLTVTNKSAVARLARELTKAEKPVKQAIKKAQSVWSCECGKTKKLDFQQVSDVGIPFCSCKDNQEMSLIGIVIDGHQFLKL